MVLSLFKKRKLKLRFKFILLFVGITILPLLVTLGILTDRIEKMQRENIIEQSRQNAVVAAEEIRAFLLSRFAILENVSTLYGAFPPETTLQSSFLDILLSRNADVIELSLLNNRGKEIARKSRGQAILAEELGDRASSHEFFAVLKNDYYLGPTTFVNGGAVFTIGRSITGTDGTFRGAIFADVDARVLQDVVVRVAGLGAHQVVYVVSDKGTTVARSDPGRDPGGTDFANVDIVRKLLTGDADEKPLGLTYTSWDGNEALGGGVSVHFAPNTGAGADISTGWIVISEAPTLEALAGVRQIRQFAMILLFAVFILSIGSSAVFAGRVAGPIEEIYRASKVFAEGNLQHRVTVKTNDEIEDLGDQFNIMAGELSRSIAALRKDREIMTGERNKLQVILSGISDAVIAVDGRSSIVLFNKTAEDIIGLAAQEVLGKPIGDVLKLFENEKEILSVRYCPVQDDSEGIVFTRNALRISSAKKDFFANILVGKIGHTTGDAVNCILTIHDVSRDQLIEKMKTEFVSVAAHQLRTPLTGIKWSLKMLLNGELGELPPSQKEMIDHTYASTERMIAIINDLLDVTRIEEGRYVYKTAFTHIEQLVDEVVEAEKSDAEGRKIIIIVNKAPGLSEARVDPDAIKLVLRNLIENAVHYTPSGGAVTVAIHERKGNIEVSVADSGVGITESEKPRIFSKFFRGAHALRLETEGSGLGLFIVKNIIEAHHGIVWFESQEGKGTTFSFSLPL